MPFVETPPIQSGKCVEWTDGKGVHKSGKVTRSLSKIQPDDGGLEVIVESRILTVIPCGKLEEPAAAGRKRGKTSKRKNKRFNKTRRH